MMSDQDLLDICLKVTGAFESGGAPSYTTVAGNFDGMGMSIGILQWNAGQGTLQALLQNIGQRMGWDKAQTFFKSDIHHLAVLKTQEAIQFCLDHYIATGSTHVDPNALAAWRNFLSQPESIAAQVEMASSGVLFRARTLVQQYCPTYINATRSYAFFFDLVTQSGGMQNKRGHVLPWTGTDAPDLTEALAFATNNSPKTAGMWEIILPNDGEATLLCHYAYERSKLSDPQFIWDAFSRRGSIACRTGFVHGVKVDLTQVLD